MKTGVHLVNIARGGLVDQDALRTALDDGTVAMATLDTVDPEPLPAGHWLYSHPKVRLTAHVSWYTPDLQQAAFEILLENIGRYLKQEPLLHVVDLDEGY
jgi:phosphoglycerate dehydrogenase-like enzyme